MILTPCVEILFHIDLVLEYPAPHEEGIQKYCNFLEDQYHSLPFNQPLDFPLYMYD